MCLYGCASALLSGHTQEQPRLPLGLAAPAGSVAGSSCRGLQWSRQSSLVTELNQE